MNECSDVPFDSRFADRNLGPKVSIPSLRCIAAAEAISPVTEQGRESEIRVEVEVEGV